jgi:glycosyltransferase involved in cell wall biosynthesis
MRLLFVKPSLVWPRTSGHDVYCYFMMRELAKLGATVSLATADPLDPKAVEDVALEATFELSSDEDETTGLSLSGLRERFRSFWGINRSHIASVQDLVSRTRPDVVIAFGLPALPYLAGVKGPVRVWAMADEWVYHHLSQLHVFDRSSWHHAHSAVIKGLYERAYRGLVDRAWAVSDTDRRAAHWFAGIRHVDLLPNGVDTDFYRPMPEPVTPDTAVFWGRLDFEPNIDALVWFCREVWPDVLRAIPTAKFTIIGYNPTPVVEDLAKLPRVELMPNVDDLRAEVCRHAVVALPMVSGGGIKNKLLEGAAMARPIVCTPRARMDLRSRGTLPVVVAQTAEEWVTSLASIWRDEQRRRDLGADARRWVAEFYSWETPARNAIAGFEESMRTRR